MPTLYFEFDRRSDFSAPDYFRQRHAYRSPRSSAATNLEIQSFLYSVLKLKKSQGDFAFDFNNTAVRITEGSTESFVLNSQIPESTEQSGLEDLAVRLNTLKARIGALESKRVNTGSYLKSATLAWRAKDVEGLKAPDISGNGFDALFGADGENPTANDPVHLERDDESYLYLPGVVGNYVEVPDSAALDITGDIDLRVDVALDDWSTNPYILGKDGTASGGYSLRQISDGTLRLLWDDGVTALSKTSTSPMGASEGERLQVRATLDVDNGAGGHDVKFYTRSSGDLSSDFGWTQLGPTITTAGTTAIGADTNDLAIGAYGPGSGQCTGKLYRAIIKDGIDGDTVLDLDFTAGDKTRPRDASLISTATGAWRAASIAPDGSLKDLTGNGRNMVPSGDPTVLDYDGTRYLYLDGQSGNYASVPDEAVLDITGDIDLRADVAGDWSQAINPYLINKQGFGVNGGWFLRIVGGDLYVGWSDGASSNNANSTVPVDSVAADGDRLQVRATLDVDNGASGHDVTFYTRAAGTDLTNDDGWVQLGDVVVVAGVTSIGTASEKVAIGAFHSGSASPFEGGVYAAVVKDGIDGSTVLDIDFSDVTQFPDGMDSTSGTAAAGVDQDYLRLNGTSGTYASVPDEAALDITGDIDISVDVAMDDWTPGTAGYFFSKWTIAAGDNRSWNILLSQTGNLVLQWSPDGTFGSAINATSTATVTSAGVVNGARHAIRVTLDVDNGAGGYDVKFYVDGVQLGATVTGGSTTSIFSGTADVTVSGINSGTTPVTGKFYGATVKDGIDGTTVLDIDFADGVPGATSQTATTGQTVTLNGSAFYPYEGSQTVTLEGRALIVDKPALYLDGVDDYLSIPDDDAFDLANGDTWTAVVSFMSKEGNAGSAFLLSKSTGTGPTNPAGWAIYTYNDGPIAGVWDGSVRTIRGSGYPPISGPTYIGGGLDASGNVFVYGPDSAWSDTPDVTTGTHENAHGLAIGASGNANTLNFGGEIFGAAIFVGQVLTEAEIVQAGKELSLTFSDTTEFYGYDETRSKVLARTSQVGSIIRSTVDKKSVVVERDVLLFGDAAYMRIMDPEFDFSSDYTIITAVRTHNTPDETQQFFNTGLGAGPAVRLEQTTDDTFRAVQVSGSSDAAEIPIVYGHIQIVALGYDTESEEFFLSANGITDKDLTRSAGDPSNDDRDMGIGSNTTGSNNRLDAEMFGMAVYIGRVLTPTEIGIIGRELLGDSNYA